MDTTTSTLLTGLVVVGGNVAKGKGVSVQIVIAVLFLAMMFSIMGDSNPPLAQHFALLILVVAVVANAPAILDGLNVGGKKKK